MSKPSACCNSFAVDTVLFTVTADTRNKYKQRVDLLSTESDWLRAAQLDQLRRGILKFSEPPTIVGDRRRAL